jgi:hypothetical protein
MKHTIELFMWGYQPHFRISVRIRAKDVFDLLGVDVEPKVLLVGVRRQNFDGGHPVCVEPEDDEWSVSTFEGLGEQVEQAILSHPLQRMLYTNDEAAMREKPERIRRLTIAEQVKSRLEPEDEKLDQKSFCSVASPVDDYYVVCVLQLPGALFRQYPAVEVLWQGQTDETSLVHACIKQLLKEAQRGLMLPDPGRGAGDDGMRSGREIILHAAASFMRNPFGGRAPMFDLFNAVVRLSQLRYEKRPGLGSLIIAGTGDPNIEFTIRLAKPVPLSNTRWARKMLQMATAETALIVDDDGSILGLARSAGAPPFCVEFIDHNQWDFRRAEQVLLRYSFGEVRLPQEPIGEERFIDNMRRVFKGIDEPAIGRYRNVLNLLVQLRHGSSLVIASDAAEEAQRLTQQGTVIMPTPITRELLERATAIDGSILADPQGICYAIGVILDGQASAESTPSRGARYNSAVRYVSHKSARRMAFVLSEDRTLDVVPLLRPRISRTRIAEAVSEIQTATFDTYHKARSFLDTHRFYLDAEQCRIVNEALDRIENEPQEVGRLVMLTARFQPHSAMNDSFLT